jgi:hypothetical protein
VYKRNEKINKALFTMQPDHRGPLFVTNQLTKSIYYRCIDAT